MSVALNLIIDPGILMIIAFASTEYENKLQVKRDITSIGSLVNIISVYSMSGTMFGLQISKNEYRIQSLPSRRIHS